MTEIGGLLPPHGPQLGGGGAGLPPTRVRRRFTLDRSTFEPRRMTALACFELLDPGIRFDVDLGGAVATVDRLHIDGVEELTLAFDGFTPTSLGVNLRRVTATNLVLVLR